jgi:hypothetical protein
MLTLFQFANAVNAVASASGHAKYVVQALYQHYLNGYTPEETFALLNPAASKREARRTERVEKAFGDD